MPRDEFSAETKSKLRLRVGGLCSNPGCGTPTSGAGSGPADVVSIGQASHIHAASPGGPRYRDEMTPEARRDIGNGIWLCTNCATAIDRDVDRHSPELLVAWRTEAERKSQAAVRIASGPATSATHLGDDAINGRSTAAALLSVAWHRWPRPPHVAMLEMEMRPEGRGGDRRRSHLGQDDDEVVRPVPPAELAELVSPGCRVVVYGPGGVGKTTLLLDLCARRHHDNDRILLFIDAAAWARTGAALLDYIASLPAARASEVTAETLGRLGDAGSLVVLVNGWNEVAPAQRQGLRESVVQLLGAFPRVGLVVASRSRLEAPAMPGGRAIAVIGLRWPQQQDVIRAELGDDAPPLLELLARSNQLRHSARNPLILRGLIAEAREGRAAAANTFELLAAAIRAHERDDERASRLAVPPVEGHQVAYLEELACCLTDREATTCSRNDALRAMHVAAAELTQRRLIGSVPSPSDVLAQLAGHHVLQMDDDAVRFSHQRFQEYFAASRLLREGLQETALPALREAINRPSWDPALDLLAECLSGTARAAGRSSLVSAALQVDVGRACELAAACGFSERESPDVHRRLVERIEALANSPHEETRQLGFACKVASRLAAFGASVLQAVECDDRSVRLQAHRGDGAPLSVSQLGDAFLRRWRSWPAGRQAEFVHEIAANESNYEFLATLAEQATQHEVRSAAISALVWHYPASEVPLRAWGCSPTEVRDDGALLDDVCQAAEASGKLDVVMAQLARDAELEKPPEYRLALAFRFPQEFGARAVDIALGRLIRPEGRESEERLAALVKAHAPQRLVDAAAHLAREQERVPPWAADCLREAAPSVRNELFELAWPRFLEPDPPGAIEVLAPMANRSQVARAVRLRLQMEGDDRNALGDEALNRYRRLERILVLMPGDALLEVVLDNAGGASYGQAAHLLELLLHRIEQRATVEGPHDPWCPAPTDVSRLLQAFAGMKEVAAVPQDRVYVLLGCIASHADPDEFGQFLLETCRRHLDAWIAFRASISRWSLAREGPRPENPQWSFFIVGALVRWGQAALPGLIALLEHPQACEVVPDAIAAIAAGLRSEAGGSEPAGSSEANVTRSVRIEPCVAAAHPDEASSALVAAGRALGDLLQARLAAHVHEAGHELAAEYRLGRLACAVAKMPTVEAVGPVMSAVASGLIDLHATVGALKSHVAQGRDIVDALVVHRMLALCLPAEGRRWVDDSSRHALSELCYLLACATDGPGSPDLGVTLEHWRRCAPLRSIVARLGSASSDRAFAALVRLAGMDGVDVPAVDGFGFALARTLSSRHVSRLLEEVGSGRLFAWARDRGSLRELAYRLSPLLDAVADGPARLVDHCRRIGTSAADAFAADVLLRSPEGRPALMSLMLEALDLGRGSQPTTPAYRTLEEMTMLEGSVEEGEALGETRSIECNQLRKELFRRAHTIGPVADACRRLLSSIEMQRREGTRPPDELRHPMDVGRSWTDVLTASAAD